MRDVVRTRSVSVRTFFWWWENERKCHCIDLFAVHAVCVMSGWVAKNLRWKKKGNILSLPFLSLDLVSMQFAFLLLNGERGKMQLCRLL